MVNYHVFLFTLGHQWCGLHETLVSAAHLWSHQKADQAVTLWIAPCVQCLGAQMRQLGGSSPGAPSSGIVTISSTHKATLAKPLGRGDTVPLGLGLDFQGIVFC